MGTIRFSYGAQVSSLMLFAVGKTWGKYSVVLKGKLYVSKIYKKERTAKKKLLLKCDVARIR